MRFRCSDLPESHAEVRGEASAARFGPYGAIFIWFMGMALCFPSASSAADAMFFSSGDGHIYTTDLTGNPNPPTSVWTATSTALVYDRYTDQLFWGAGDVVDRGAADGSGSATFVAQAVGTPVGKLALDPVGGMVYWASYSGSPKIFRAPSTGGAAVLVASPTNLRAIAIDPRPGHRKFYYAAIGGTILQSSLDGAPSFSALPNTFVDDIASMAVDTCTNKFVVLGQMSAHPGPTTPWIMTADLVDAGNQQTLLSGYASIGCTNPIDDNANIAVDENHWKICWSTHDCSVNPQIHRANRDGTSPGTIVTQSSSAQAIYGLQLRTPAACAVIGVPTVPFTNPWIAGFTALFLAAFGSYLAVTRARRTLS